MGSSTVSTVQCSISDKHVAALLSVSVKQKILNGLDAEEIIR